MPSAAPKSVPFEGNTHGNNNTATDPSTLTVAIIGGGIAGINLALGIEHRNESLNSKINYTIYERAPGFREIGAGIGFSPNAERAMGLLSPDVLASFKRVANPNGEDYFQWVDGFGSDELLFKLYCGKDGFQGCRRSDILEEWAKLIPAERVRFGKTVEGVVEEEEEEGQVRVTFADGEEVRADVVVGCDGIRSRIRQIVLEYGSTGSKNKAKATIPHYTSKFCYRALVPMDQSVATIGEYRSGTRFMYNGPGAHIITYPVGSNSVLNVLAVLSDDKPWADLKKHTAEGSKQEVVKAFAGWHETAKKIVGMMPDQMDKWGIFDMAEWPAPGYVSAAGGRVCVAGDAAHATGPHLGAGGGLGIEDALVLSELLEGVAARLGGGGGGGESGMGGRSKGELVKDALGVYNNLRYERTQWVVQATRFACDLFQWQNKEVGSDGERFGGEITKTFHKVWDYDVEGMVKKARAGLERLIHNW